MTTTRRATGINAGDPTRTTLADLFDIQTPTWHTRGLCNQTDPEAFFPEKGGSTREAKAVCNGTPAKDGRPAIDPCPVRAQCLAWALEADERFGIWGGRSERERRRIKRGHAA